MPPASQFRTAARPWTHRDRQCLACTPRRRYESARSMRAGLLYGHGFEATATRIIPRDDLLAISRANLRYANAGDTKARNGLSV